MPKYVVLLLSNLMVAFVLLANCTIAQSVRATVETQEKFVRLIAVRGNQITVVESSGRGRRGSASGQGGMSGTGMSRRGQGQSRRRGRFGLQSNASNGNSQAKSVLTVDRKVRLTFAIQERRTNEFRVGADINGRLKNDIFRRISTNGLSARVVIQGSRLMEVNIIQANDTSNDEIAVKPKRPPRRK